MEIGVNLYLISLQECLQGDGVEIKYLRIMNNK